MIKVLHVEDNPADVLLTRKAFVGGNQPYDITVAQTGEEALAILAKKAPYENATTPDFVLLDMVLPKMTGNDVLAAIKTTDGMKHIPVIILSGVRGQIETVYKNTNGADFCLAKPSDQAGYAQLLQLVDRVWVPMMLQNKH
jgi:CheY-like chemotaxis protein